MGVGYFVFAEERSELAGSAPSRDEITAALRTVADRNHAFPRAGLPDAHRSIGRWVGPAPRVTRVVVPIATGNAFRTRVAWIYGISDEEEAASIPTNAQKQEFSDRLADDVMRELEAHAGRPAIIGTHWTVTVTPYNAAENGSPEWWEGGGASRDATYTDTFPSLIQQRIPDDNPSGPNEIHRNPTPADPLTTIAWIVGGVAVVALAIEFGPAIASWVPRKATPAPKQMNPRSRR